MIKTVIESPYAGDVEANMEYLNSCIRHSLYSGEAPFASHLMYTTALCDKIPEERKLGIEAGFEWHSTAEKIVFYVDLGISRGMLLSYEKNYKTRGITFRSLEEKTDKAFSDVDAHMKKIGLSADNVEFVGFVDAYPPRGENECNVPPPVWSCSRDPGHDGPCAASPVKRR